MFHGLVSGSECCRCSEGLIRKNNIFFLHGWVWSRGLREKETRITEHGMQQN